MEVLRGRYTSYGTVFKDGGSSELRVTPIHEQDSEDVKNNTEYVLWQYGTWSDICTLEFSLDFKKEKERQERFSEAIKILHDKSLDAETAIRRSNELMEDGPDKYDQSCGIAAFHKKCYKSVEPTTRSQPDPDQGWGENWEYFGSTGKVEDGGEPCQQNTEKTN